MYGDIFNSFFTSIPKTSSTTISDSVKINYENVYFGDRINTEELNNIYSSLRKCSERVENPSMLNNAWTTSVKKVCLGINSQQLDDENVDNLFGAIDFFKNKGYEVIATVCTEPTMVNERVPYSYTADQLEKFEEINDQLISMYGKDLELRYSEDTQLNYSDTVDQFWRNTREVISGFERKWTHSQIKSANTQVDSLVDKIRENNFTPFETVMFLHGRLSKMPYKEGNFGAEARTLPGVLAGKNEAIVCVGYATLMKSVIDRLNDPNLSCDINLCYIQDTNHSLKEWLDPNYNPYGGHANNIIKIKDDKYKVDGVYMEDVCWNAPKAKESQTENDTELESRGYSCCLYPIQDLYNMRKLRYIQQKPNTNENIINGAHISASEQLKKVRDGGFFKLLIKGEGLYYKYAKRSNPIGIEKYSAGLKNVVHSLDPTITPDQVNYYVANEMDKTKAAARDKFKPSSKTSFVK